MTSDGGQAWHGVPTSGGPVFRFADKNVGWVFNKLGGGQNFVLNYTVDGGKKWTSRPLRFPAVVHGFSLPATDRGYVVGEHGMVYRYRIVPASYTAANIIEAPVMPSSAAETHAQGEPH